MSKRRAFAVWLLGFLVAVIYYYFYKCALSYPKNLMAAYYYSTQNKQKWVSHGYQNHTNGTTAQRPPTSLSFNEPAPTAAFERERYIVDTTGCKIPNFDPFDKSLRKCLKKVGEYNCKGKPSFILLLNETTPVIDVASLLKAFRYKPKDVRCTYSEIFRNESIPAPDHSFFLKPEVTLNFGAPLSVGYIHVQCYQGEQMFHEEYLLVPLLKKDVEERCEKARRESEDKGSGLNILILGMDSMSRLNFNRHFNATGRYVRNFLKRYELMGYNKVGSNSFPNLTPLLTGLSGSEATSLTGGEFFDSPDILWTLHAKKGYRTLFHEEEPETGVYAHLRKGMKHAPTDYYTRHAVMAIDKSKLKKSFCLGPRPSLGIYLDYMHRLLKTFDQRPFFAYFWINEMVHDDPNNAAHFDTPLKDALVKLHDSGILNNTLLAFLGDHGNRIGDLRKTYIGRLEDCLQFAFLVFPPWFLRHHPDFAASLEVNQRRLSTHYDMHATLLQLLHSRLAKTATRHGKSLFYELPETRTCADASVPFQYCSCAQTEALPVTHPLTLAVGHFVISRLNAVVRSKKYKIKCKQWALKSVLRMQFYPYTNGTAASSGAEGNTTDRYYSIKISATPNNAWFEAAVKHTADSQTSKFSMMQPADRLDWYRPHSKCVRGKRWEEYCYCKK